MPLVVVGHGSKTALFPGQSRLGAIQSLDLTFFVNGQDDRVVGRVQIEADHIFQLFREVAIVAQREGLHPLRFEAVRPPDAAHGRSTDGGHLRLRARTPVSGIGRRLVGDTISSILLAAMIRGRPKRGASFSIPAIPRSRNRRRQRPAV